MFEWLSISLLSFAIAMKTTKWRFRVPLALLAGFVSAGVGAVSMLGDDPFKKISKVLIGGVINWVVCIFLLSFFAWLLRPARVHIANEPAIPVATNVTNDVPTENPSPSALQIVVDEDRIYAAIAKELEDDVADKGLWTRLFAECNGDERKMKVLYIKQRADKLIAQEQSRLTGLERARKEQERLCAIEAVRIETKRLENLPTKMRLAERIAKSDFVLPSADYFLDQVAKGNTRKIEELLAAQEMYVAASDAGRETVLFT